MTRAKQSQWRRADGSSGGNGFRPQGKGGGGAKGGSASQVANYPQLGAAGRAPAMHLTGFAVVAPRAELAVKTADSRADGTQFNCMVDMAKVLYDRMLPQAALPAHPGAARDWVNARRAELKGPQRAVVTRTGLRNNFTFGPVFVLPDLGTRVASGPPRNVAQQYVLAPCCAFAAPPWGLRRVSCQPCAPSEVGAAGKRPLFLPHTKPRGQWPCGRRHL